jgi:hypothetical protein
MGSSATNAAWVLIWLESLNTVEMFICEVNIPGTLKFASVAPK